MEPPGPDFLQFFGRLHPLLAHVAPPLVLWAAVAEFLSRSDEASGGRRTRGLLLVATLAGLLAAGSGWTNLEQEGHLLDATQRLHRVVGIGLAALLPTALLLSVLGRMSDELRAAARVATFAAGACALLSLQLGGTLVFGEGHLVSALAPPADRVAATSTPRPGGAPAVAPSEPALADPSGAAEETAPSAEPDEPPAEAAAAGPSAPSEAAPPTPEPSLDAPPARDPVPAPTPRPVADLDGRLAELEAGGVLAHRVFRGSDTIEVDASFAGAFGDADLDRLQGLEGVVETLVLSRTAVTDAAGPRLRSFDVLDSLRLDRTAFGDAGLRALAGSPVRVLNLYGSRVSDAGLPALADLPRLQTVFLWNTEVTDEGVAALAASLPGVEIVR